MFESSNVRISSRLQSDNTVYQNLARDQTSFYGASYVNTTNLQFYPWSLVFFRKEYLLKYLNTMNNGYVTLRSLRCIGRRAERLMCNAADK